MLLHGAAGTTIVTIAIRGQGMTEAPLVPGGSSGERQYVAAVHTVRGGRLFQNRADTTVDQPVHLTTQANQGLSATVLPEALQSQGMWTTRARTIGGRAIDAASTVRNGYWRVVTVVANGMGGSMETLRKPSVRNSLYVTRALSAVAFGVVAYVSSKHGPGLIEHASMHGTLLGSHNTAHVGVTDHVSHVYDSVHREGQNTPDVLVAHIHTPEAALHTNGIETVSESYANLRDGGTFHNHFAEMLADAHRATEAGDLHIVYPKGEEIDPNLFYYVAKNAHGQWTTEPSDVLNALARHSDGHRVFAGQVEHSGVSPGVSGSEQAHGGGTSPVEKTPHSPSPSNVPSTPTSAPTATPSYGNGHTPSVRPSYEGPGFWSGFWTGALGEFALIAAGVGIYAYAVDRKHRRTGKTSTTRVQSTREPPLVVSGAVLLDTVFTDKNKAEQRNGDDEEDEEDEKAHGGRVMSRSVVSIISKLTRSSAGRREVRDVGRKMEERPSPSLHELRRRIRDKGER